jgi:hypothetical protein
MINIDKVIGKAVVYTGENSLFFTKGEAYRIGRDEYDTLFTVDNEGERHTMDEDWLSEVFDVSAYIEKPSLVGKYVRYIGDYSDFMRTGDIGIVIATRGDGNGLKVKWLNPIEKHTEVCPAWFCCAVNVEVVE